MKAILVKSFAFLLIIAALLSLSACDGEHVSSYNATLMVRSSFDDTCAVRFGTFEGRLVFKLRAPSGRDTDISYEATLDEGEINVYYESSATAGKTELFTVKGGESESSRSGYVVAGSTVYVFVETPSGNNKAKGGDIRIFIN